MYKGKEEPLTVNNSNKLKGKSGSISMKKRTGSQRHKKKRIKQIFSISNLYTYFYNLYCIIFLFCLFNLQKFKTNI